MKEHEDHRRIIYDWADGVFKSAKAVIVKEAMPIGDHHHLKKDEEFFLLSGRFYEVTVGTETKTHVCAPFKVRVPRGIYHKFVCEPGSVLLGVATEEFDPTDEIPGRPILLSQH